MLRLGLIGERLSHSLSAVIHETFSRETGIPLTYRLIEIPAGQLDRQVPALLHELDGLNVTIPYKQRVIPFLDALDEQAQAIGAVNTISCGHGQSCGFNTDVAGFSTMLRAAGLDPCGQSCFVLGTGGASKAAGAALRNMRAQSVTFVSRHPGEGEISYAELRERFSGLLVNTTPVGMWPHPDACPLESKLLSDLLSKCTGVADVIYNPAETVLTQAAKKRGIPACTGAVMLAAQALEAERIWTGRALPDQLIEPMVQAIRQALAVA